MTATDATVVDVVVIGLGPGGEYAARKLAESGLTVIGVDRHLVGGECPFYGCTPSKLLVRATDVLAEAKRAVALGGEVEVRPDFSLPRGRIVEATHDWDDVAHVEPLTEAGVDVVRGHGRLDGPGRVVVETVGGPRTFVASHGVILNAGTEPATLPIDGLAGTPYLTNREVFRLTELPESMVVVGGGPIGCELTQVFARLGVRVTLLEVDERILGVEEPESGEVIARVLRDEGVDVRTGVNIERVSHDRVFHLQVDGEKVSAEQLLVAAGRRNLLADAGLETLGLDPEMETIETDERMRAGERLWAVGDATGKGAYTHVSLYQADIAVRDLLGRDGRPADYRAVSRVTFTDPEVASVGMSEQQARDTGIRVITGLADLTKTSRGWIHGPGNDGIIKVVGDADRGVLVGATAVGPYGGEIIGMLVAAVHAEIPVTTLRGMHFAYPTFHRAIESALDDLAGDR